MSKAGTIVDGVILELCKRPGCDQIHNHPSIRTGCGSAYIYKFPFIQKEQIFEVLRFGRLEGSIELSEEEIAYEKLQTYLSTLPEK